jgi:hypothetical protein
MNRFNKYSEITIVDMLPLYKKWEEFYNYNGDDDTLKHILDSKQKYINKQREKKLKRILK